MTTKLLNNRYQVIEVLGAGGFGETFLADDTHLPSRRRCVIKQLKPLLDEPKTYQNIQQRFEREAAILEFLGEGSEQIPNLYAYFSENGLFYLVQEWIQGQTLTNIVEADGCLDQKSVKEILLSLLPVLEYVHSKGIIHRDIKPDNIILRNSNRKPVLIDFGAVKETVRTAIISSGNPTKSMVIGTPGYMPIEQGLGHPVFASDIYSLALTAIYLLTGKHPHELESNPQTAEIIWENYAPQRLSNSLKTVLSKAISPNVGDRYSTASKMLDALQSNTQTNAVLPVQNTQQTVAVSPGARIPQNTPNSANKSKPPVIVGGLLAIGLIGGVAIANFNRQQPEEDVVISQTPGAESRDRNSIPSVEPSLPESPSSEATVTKVQPTKTPEIPSPPKPRITPPQPQQQITIEPKPEVRPINIKPPVISTPAPQPQIIYTPAPAPIPTATTIAIATPTPIPTPSASIPPKDPVKPVPTNTSNRDFPVFPTGTSESDVKAKLGQPTKLSRGLWRTRAYLYELQPNRVDLGLLFDRQSGRLRQTEASLAQSVGANVMQETLQEMLSGNINGDIKQGLQRVYQRQNRKYSFRKGNLKGVVERNKEDRIYIAVWDADLH
ncbi:MAG: protein kinase [Rivularia sp. (in: cyanobacteria)]